MLTPHDRQEKIEEIRHLPDLLQRALEELEEEELDQPYRPQGWTRRQVVHHIADSHLNAYIRMKLIVTESHPVLKTYDQEEWAELSDVSMPVDVSMNLIRSLHQRWAYFLDGLREEEWSRGAFHPENGEVVLWEMLDYYARHGRSHVLHLLSGREEKEAREKEV